MITQESQHLVACLSCLSPRGNTTHCDSKKPVKKSTVGHTQVAATLGRQREGDLYDYEASLVYKMSSRAARTVTQRP